MVTNLSDSLVVQLHKIVTTSICKLIPFLCLWVDFKHTKHVSHIIESSVDLGFKSLTREMDSIQQLRRLSSSHVDSNTDVTQFKELLQGILDEKGVDVNHVDLNGVCPSKFSCLKCISLWNKICEICAYGIYIFAAGMDTLALDYMCW